MQDVIIIGGGFAGLSAAMMLARGRRKVTVIDQGEPRNRFASHSHGVLALDGQPPSEILTAARRQLLAYPTAEIILGAAESVSGDVDAFEVRLADGKMMTGRRVLISTGYSDRLPEIPGLAERWGKSVFHCPYCHGYEIGGGAIGVIASIPMSPHQAAVVADWGDVTYFSHGVGAPDEDNLAMLQKRGVVLETAHIAGIEGDGDGVEGVRLVDGRLIAVRALFVVPRPTIRSNIPSELGLEIDDLPSGPVIRTDNIKRTSKAGIYAAGDIARPPGNITLSSADGVLASTGIHHSLMFGS